MNSLTQTCSKKEKALNSKINNYFIRFSEIGGCSVKAKEIVAKV